MAIVVMLIGAVVTAVVLGNVSAIIDAMGHAEDRKRRLLDNVTDFLTFNSVDEETKDKVNSYIEFFWLKHRGYSLHEVVGPLPTSLKVAVGMEMNGSLLEGCYIFKKLDSNLVFQTAFLKDISWRLKPLVALKGQIIGETGDFLKGIYFIKQGSALLQSKGGEITYTILRDGMNFGEQTALGIVPYWNYTVVARVNTDLLVLEHSDLEDVLSLFPNYVGTLKERAKRRVDRLEWIIDQKIDACNYDLQTVLKLKAELRGEATDPASIFFAKRKAEAQLVSSVDESDTASASESYSPKKPLSHKNSTSSFYLGSPMSRLSSHLWQTEQSDAQSNVESSGSLSARVYNVDLTEDMAYEAESHVTFPPQVIEIPNVVTSRSTATGGLRRRKKEPAPSRVSVAPTKAAATLEPQPTSVAKERAPTPESTAENTTAPPPIPTIDSHTLTPTGPATKVVTPRLVTPRAASSLAPPPPDPLVQNFSFFFLLVV